MNEYPWQAQYTVAMQVQNSAFHLSADLTECVAAAESKIYDRLEDYLQGRQRLDSAEFHAIKEALCSLRNIKHEVAA